MTEAAPPECAAPGSVGFSQAGLNRLTAALNEQIAKKRLPGAVALIMRQGKLAYFEALGD